MALFELDDGDLRKFWEVRLDGVKLSFRFGDLGTSGRTRTRTHPDERRAREGYDTAVRAMLAQGYGRRLELQVVDGASFDSAWAQLEQNPDDIAALAVHSDWLQGEGDPRGEVLALHLAGHSDEAERQRARCDRALMEKVARFPGRVELDWRWGYVRAARFETADLRGVDPAGAAAAILSEQALRLVRSVQLRVPLAAQVALARPLGAVRSLALGSVLLTEGRVPAEPLDLDRLGRCMPRLRTLKVRGVTEVVGSGALGGLTDLDVDLNPGWTERIPQICGALRSLGVHGFDARHLAALASRGCFGGLEKLSIMPLTDPVGALVEALARGPGPRQLVLGGVDLGGAEAARLADIDGLNAVEVGGTIARSAVVELQRRGIVLLGEPRIAPDSDDEVDPERPLGLEVQRLELGSKPSRRFWEIGRHGTVHHVRYGRLGAAGRWVWLRFPNEDIAEEMLQKRVEEKLREGYRRAACEEFLQAAAEPPR